MGSFIKITRRRKEISKVKSSAKMTYFCEKPYSFSNTQVFHKSQTFGFHRNKSNLVSLKLRKISFHYATLSKVKPNVFTR